MNFNAKTRNALTYDKKMMESLIAKIEATKQMQVCF